MEMKFDLGEQGDVGVDAASLLTDLYAYPSLELRIRRSRMRIVQWLLVS